MPSTVIQSHVLGTLQLTSLVSFGSQNKFSSWTLPICLTAIDTANNDPHKDPYRTEEGDDTVEKMVRTVISHLQEGGKKGRHKPQFKR